MSNLKRWLLPRSAPARIVVAIVVVCTPWVAWRGWLWWVNARTVAWVASTGGVVSWAIASPVDPLAAWREHPALGTIDWIGFGSDRLPGPAELERLRRLPELRWLDLSGSGIGDEHLAHLPPLPRLEWLDLDSSGVTDAGLAKLAGRTSLNYISLSGTRVTDAGMAHLSGLDRLEELWLEGTAVGDAGLRALRPLTGLEKLTVGERVTDAGIDEIVRHRKLTHLHFFGSAVTDAGMERLMRELPGLEEVLLYHVSTVTPAMIKTLRAKGINVNGSN